MAAQTFAVRFAEYGNRVFDIRTGIIKSDMTAGVQSKYDKLIEGQRNVIYETRLQVLLGEQECEDPRAALFTIDELWADYLAEIAELKSGIHWVSFGGKNPFDAFLHEAEQLFHVVHGRIAEAIGLDFDDSLEVVTGKGRVVVGEIVGRVSVLVRTGFLQDVTVNIRRVLFRTAKHHVLEEMGEARLAWLDFVARSGLHRDLDRDDIGVIGPDDDHAQPVVELAHQVGHVEYLCALRSFSRIGSFLFSAGHDQYAGQHAHEQLFHSDCLHYDYTRTTPMTGAACKRCIISD